MLKVMSFNLRYGLAEDGANRWEKRKALALDRVQAFDPDLLGLQECRDDAQAEFVRARLPGYHFLGQRRGGAGEPALEMTAVLFRESAFQVLEHGHFWLSENPSVPGSRSWDAVFPRTATWVRLRPTTVGRALTFVNTHFDYQPAAIDEAAAMLRQWLDEAHKDSPVVVTGDFNADKDSAAYRRLTGGALRDAYRQAHSRPDPDDEATFHGFGKPEALTAIDWILVSEHFRVVQAGVDRTRRGRLFSSDHYPVWAILG